MKQILIILTLFFLGCDDSKKDYPTSETVQKVDYKTEKMSKEYSEKIDSFATIIKRPEYDSTQLTYEIAIVNALRSNDLRLTAEKGLAPDLVDAILTQSKPYENIASGNEAACDGFYTIERGQFRSGTDTYYTSVTRDDDNKLKLFGLVKGEFKKSSKAFILDFCNYLDTTCIEGGHKKKVKLAAGLRITYFVKDWGLNIAVDGLEKIAAAKELNFSESSLKVSTIGWGQNDDALYTLKTALQKITVKSYPEACSALLNLLTAYKSAKALKPQVIASE